MQPGENCFRCAFYRPSRRVNFCFCRMHRLLLDINSCKKYQPAQDPSETGVVPLPDDLKRFSSGEILPVVEPILKKRCNTAYVVRAEDREYLLENGRPFRWRDSDPNPETVDAWIEEILQPRKWAGKCRHWYIQRKKAMAELAKLRPIKFT